MLYVMFVVQWWVGLWRVLGVVYSVSATEVSVAATFLNSVEGSDVSV